jgi:hypothetical protein
MQRLTFAGGALTFALVMSGGCTETGSATELVPEGPPMVRQVFMTETLVDPATGLARAARSIAFGDHPEFDENDDRVVETGAVASTNKVRIVVDELLIGNNLEQIQCRDGVYRSVPEGTTPDDIARCATANDVLADTCNGPHAVCLDDTGVPVGVMDEVPTGGDGASDDTQFISGIVSIECSGITVPIDITNTFWQPSGNQQVPAAGGFDSVGPAIIVQTTQGFPTSSSCTIDLANSIVDKDHIAICAPVRGGFVDGEVDPTVDCDPGDTTLIGWNTEPLRVPVHSTNPDDGAMNVPLISGGGPDALIVVQFNTTITAVDATKFVLMEGGTPRTVTATIDTNDDRIARITVPGGYIAGTTYMLIVQEGAAADPFGVVFPASQERTITFNTAP